ncbi:Uncharacterized protein dnm_056610 [Desulfonema magnum]|uniref:Uncharacterized protein n=1 Tax=Desulfonema magnum TaxID=45655 RepID=A0A975BR90_9BACT|nr:Uncharacterized protein dnm_056610 [Desulfonema magnum]
MKTDKKPGFSNAYNAFLYKIPARKEKEESGFVLIPKHYKGISPQYLPGVWLF